MLDSRATRNGVDRPVCVYKSGWRKKPSHCNLILDAQQSGEQDTDQLSRKHHDKKSGKNARQKPDNAPFREPYKGIPCDLGVVTLDGRDPAAFLERLEELRDGYGFLGPQMLKGLPEMLSSVSPLNISGNLSYGSQNGALSGFAARFCPVSCHDVYGSADRYLQSPVVWLAFGLANAAEKDRKDLSQYAAEILFYTRTALTGDHRAAASGQCLPGNDAFRGASLHAEMPHTAIMFWESASPAASPRAYIKSTVSTVPGRVHSTSRSSRRAKDDPVQGMGAPVLGRLQPTPGSQPRTPNSRFHGSW
ncbi:hypothetical protein EAG_10047 [Camponotus floridanus]|uniref:Uncharacterized protein n=1 Tax=Camponotus floridanus TaxID=104421 RepID=E1ZVQ3_CAMFO|nr:hypothetical protein EAG_10047 [Camponotus floridanus]